MFVPVVSLHDVVTCVIKKEKLQLLRIGAARTAGKTAAILNFERNELNPTLGPAFSVQILPLLRCTSKVFF